MNAVGMRWVGGDEIKQHHAANHSNNF